MADTFGASLDGLSRGGKPAGWVIAPVVPAIVVGSAGAGAGGTRGRDERPLSSTDDMDGEVWSVCCDPTGKLAVIGGDDGACAAWDPRYRHVSWKTEVCPSGGAVGASVNS